MNNIGIGQSFPISYLQNNFNGGEVGDKLSVNKDSDYYKSTATRIVNMITTEIGNLKLLKKPIVKSSNATFSDIQQVINTKYNFVIVITRNKILTLKKKTYELIKEIADINFDRKIARATLVENFLLVPQSDLTRKDYEINSSGNIDINNDFSNSIRKPIKDRNIIKVDIYQVRNINLGAGAKLRAYKTTTTTLQEFTVDSNKLKFKYDTSLNITRIYYPFQADLVNIESIPNMKENDYFISIFPFETSETSKFYLGNTTIEFKDKKSDVSGSFFTTVSCDKTKIGKSGTLSYGIMFDTFEKSFYAITEYQNRLIVTDGEYIYFSKIGDFNFFLNGKEIDDSFFVKLSTVNGENPKVISLMSGRGLWAITDKGVFLIGYNQIISGGTIDLRFVGNDSCTLECCVSDNSLYYLTKENALKCVQNVTETKGYLDFKINTVDKFNPTSKISSINEFMIDNKKVILATLSTNLKTNDVGAYIFKEENINVFSRTSLEVNENVIPLYNTLYLDNANILEEGVECVDKAYITLNTPPTYSKRDGYLLNDSSSTYKNLSLRFYTENIEDLKGITVNKIPSNQLGDVSQGIYSIYNFRLGGIPLTDKLEITIDTNSPQTDIELMATEIFYTVGAF